MSVDRFLVCLLLGVFPRNVWSDCTKTGPCSCEGPEGSIDLSPLDGKGSPKYKDQPDQLGSGYLFSWNPCSAFSEASGCNSVSACQMASDQSASYTLGTQDTADFVTDATTGDLNLQYTASDGTSTRTTIVTLVCDQTIPDGTLLVVGEATTLTYNFVLSSIHCCPSSGPGPGPGPNGGSGDGGLSIGSILVIAFVSLLVVYAVAGVVIQVFLRKASGKERIPNYSIWSAIPGLVKDGFVFTFTLGKKRGSYDNI
ncbi:hypothetical protein BaRGS_00020438 [Batillaria attramentaria]|uniref:Autophagy-related protein 27 n=1 Tax=Batillaria attramentaria TaxID=370345 RepID=A0ABD0KM55_9CAEN